MRGWKTLMTNNMAKPSLFSLLSINIHSTNDTTEIKDGSNRIKGNNNNQSTNGSSIDNSTDNNSGSTNSSLKSQLSLSKVRIDILFEKLKSAEHQIFLLKDQLDVLRKETIKKD